MARIAKHSFDIESKHTHRKTSRESKTYVPKGSEAPGGPDPATFWAVTEQEYVLPWTSGPFDPVSSPITTLVTTPTVFSLTSDAALTVELQVTV